MERGKHLHPSSGGFIFNEKKINGETIQIVNHKKIEQVAKAIHEFLEKGGEDVCEN